VIFVLAGNVNEFGEEKMHKVLVKKSFGKRLLGRGRSWDGYVTTGFENDRSLEQVLRVVSYGLWYVRY
jgi:hypothetical protein